MIPTSRERVFIQTDFLLGFIMEEKMFDRTLKILDSNVFLQIQKVKILLVGLGGVGGFAFEALIRLGFIHITIVDYDTFEKSNLNRQILCTENTLNQSKIDSAKSRGETIHPQVNIIKKDLFLNSETIEELNEKYDYILDACDTLTTKILLIKKALKDNSKIISCMGTGNRFNPNLIEITSLNKTYNDPLAKNMRKLLKEEGLPLNIPVVWSKELPIKTKDRTPGSIFLVPASAGLNLAFFVLEDLMNRTF